MSLATNKFINRMFRRISDVVWDPMSGSTGVRTTNGVFTIKFDEQGQNPEVTVNPFDMSIALPGFAMQTPHAEVNVGDLIVGESSILGWVVEKNAASYKLRDHTGHEKAYVPPKVAIMGVTGPLVVRNLFSVAGGAQGVAGMLPMLMMLGGDEGKLEKILPLMLLTQQTPAVAGAAPAANPMAAMLPFLLMKDGLGGKGSKMDPMMLLMLSGGLGGGGGGMNPMLMMAMLGDEDDSPAATGVGNGRLGMPARTGTRILPPPLTEI